MSARLAWLVLALSLLGCAANNPLPPLPDAEGFAGAFAGSSHGVLLFAGGSNFPEGKPWEGGTKRWYDHVFALLRPDRSWRRVATLPEPRGYGASVSYADGLICIGGGDARHNVGDVLRLEWEHGRLKTTTLPPLPAPVANACAAVVGDVLYVAGGQRSPDAGEALAELLCLDLAKGEHAWRRLAPLPGAGRILATAAGCDGAFFVIGGATLTKAGDGKVVRRYLTDAYRYDPGTGWTRVADLPTPLAASPSPAPVDGRGLFLLGGDDGSAVGLPPERHPGFNRRVLRYDVADDSWRDVDTLPVAQVTTPVVMWDGAWVVVGGEVRPGVRTPRAWRFDPTSY